MAAYAVGVLVLCTAAQEDPKQKPRGENDKHREASKLESAARREDRKAERKASQRSAWKEEANKVLEYHQSDKKWTAGHKVNFKQEAEQMHEFYCAQGDRWTTAGPCRKFAIMHSKDYASNQEKRAAAKLVDEEVPKETGRAQFKEMHDTWCESEEHSTSSATEGDMCEGWKANTEYKDEL